MTDSAVVPAQIGGSAMARPRYRSSQAIEARAASTSGVESPNASTASTTNTPNRKERGRKDHGDLKSSTRGNGLSTGLKLSAQDLANRATHDKLLRTLFVTMASLSPRLRYLAFGTMRHPDRSPLTSVDCTTLERAFDLWCKNSSKRTGRRL